MTAARSPARRTSLPPLLCGTWNRLKIKGKQRNYNEKLFPPPLVVSSITESCLVAHSPLVDDLPPAFGGGEGARGGVVQRVAEGVVVVGGELEGEEIAYSLYFATNLLTFFPSYNCRLSRVCDREAKITVSTSIYKVWEPHYSAICGQLFLLTLHIGSRALGSMFPPSPCMWCIEREKSSLEMEENRKKYFPVQGIITMEKTGYIFFRRLWKLG